MDGGCQILKSERMRHLSSQNTISILLLMSPWKALWSLSERDFSVASDRDVVILQLVPVAIDPYAGVRMIEVMNLFVLLVKWTSIMMVERLWERLWDQMKWDVEKKSYEKKKKCATKRRQKKYVQKKERDGKRRAIKSIWWNKFCNNRASHFGLILQNLKIQNWRKIL